MSAWRGVSLPAPTSANFSKLSAQFVGGAEQGVLDGTFRRIQHSGNGAQPHAVVVLEFEYHALAGRKPAQGEENALLQFATGEASFRTGGGAVVGHAFEDIFLLAFRRKCGMQVPATRMLLAQVIQA